MVQGINLAEVKQYNESLKKYRDRAASLNAEIEYTNKELDSLCLELSSELGVQVTRDNIDKIYEEQLEKINSTLQSGMAVLAKIASEESALENQPQPQQSVQPQSVGQPQVQAPQPAVQPTQFQGAQGVFQQPQTPIVNSQPVQGQQVFTSGDNSTLPPLFKLG